MLTSLADVELDGCSCGHCSSLIQWVVCLRCNARNEIKTYIPSFAPNLPPGGPVGYIKLSAALQNPLRFFFLRNILDLSPSGKSVLRYIFVFVFFLITIVLLGVILHYPPLLLEVLRYPPL